MTIRRIGFSPFVSSASYIEAQRRVEAVEKHIGADEAELDPENMTEEERLEFINAQHRAELEALEAEKAQKEGESQALRAKLTLSDGYETPNTDGPVDLKGGVEEPVADAPSSEPSPGVSLASLARANVYQTVSRAEQRDAERRAELELAAAQQAELERAEPPAEDVSAGAVLPGDEDWMKAELDALQAQDGSLEDVDAAGDSSLDPGANDFVASLEDIENLEEPEEDLSVGNGFVASLEDIALLVPETPAEEAPVAAGSAPEPTPVQAEAAPVQAEVRELPASLEGFALRPEVAPEAPSAPVFALPFDDEAVAPAPASVTSTPEAPLSLPFDGDAEPGGQG